MLADYTFLDVLWWMLAFFAFVIWFWLLISVFGDLFRRHDIGGGMKTIWIIFVIMLPFLGVFIYLISQSKGMAERSANQMQAAQQQYEAQVKEIAGSGGAADEIDKAKKLLDSGAISQAEFDSIKAKALAS